MMGMLSWVSRSYGESPALPFFTDASSWQLLRVLPPFDQTNLMEWIDAMLRFSSQDIDGDGLSTLEEWAITLTLAGHNKSACLLAPFDKIPRVTDSFWMQVSDAANSTHEPALFNLLGPGLDPFAFDSDSDLLPDGFEIATGHNGCSRNDVSVDSDGDGFSILQEYMYGTNPNDARDAPNSTAPPPASRRDGGSNLCLVRLTFGDQSGSRSERWDLEVQPELTLQTTKKMLAAVRVVPAAALQLVIFKGLLGMIIFGHRGA